MDRKRQLKSSSAIHTTPSSPLGTTTTSVSTPTNHSESGESSSNQQKWYRVSRRDKPRSKHGYEPFRFSMQKEGELRLAECVIFWPFTSPEDLERANKKWDEMEGVFAVASCGRVTVGRVSDKGYEDLWSFQTEGTDHYHVAWSYDPISLRPILASGGSSNIIWLFDHLLHGPNRILKGHGNDILSLVFHPLHPHILASASNDRTIRIWNLFGTDVEEGPHDPPLSENYPQGDADEGSCVLAILAGDKAGHKAGVSALAFHPYHNAIASGGCDNHVKIWPLPPIPRPNPWTPPTPRGYRPTIISIPLFSTDRLHKYPIDSIEWLNKDMLITRAGEEITGWKWLKYKEYFQLGQVAPIKTEVTKYDAISSHSFSITLDVVDPEADWYWRMGTHLAFNPTEDEVDFADVDLVEDTIFAYSIKGSPPRLHLLNPFTWEPGPSNPPPPDEAYRRPRTPDQDGAEIEVSNQLGDSEVMAIKIEDEIEDGLEDDMQEDRVMDEDAPMDDLESRADSDDLAKDFGLVVPEDRENSPTTRKRTMDHVTSLDPEDQSPEFTILPSPFSMEGTTPADLPVPTPNKSDKQDPWSLTVKQKDIDKALTMTKFSKESSNVFRRSRTMLRCVAISPRGAKWIIAVGERESMAIWKLKEKA